MRGGSGSEGKGRLPWWSVLLGVGIAVGAVAPIVGQWLVNPVDQRLVDLEVYRDGGRALLRGAPLYEVLTQPPQFLPFTYPPFAGLLAVPFTLMSWTAAQWAWTVVMYAALAVVVGYAFRDVIARAGRWAPVAAGALFGASAWIWPAFDQMRFGQVGFILMALCVADCAARTAYWPRGMLVGLAVAIKLVPGVFLIYFWVTGRRDAAGNAVLTAAVASLGAFALLPSDSADYWFGALLQGGDRTGAIDGTTNQAVNGVLARILAEGPVRSLLFLVLVLAVAYAGFRLARRATVTADALARDVPHRTPGGTDLMRAADAGPGPYSLLLAGVAITGLLSVLLSPVGWMHHLVWIIIVLGALLGDGRDPRRVLLAAGVWLYYLFPLPWRGAALSRGENPLLVRVIGRIGQNAFGLGALLLLFVLGFWLVNRIRAGQDRKDRAHDRTRVGTLSP